MTSSRMPQVAFSSGELSPLLYARKDYQRYQTGLRRCVGFLPLRQGGVTRAPGTIFRGQTFGDAPGRLVPFEFNEGDAIVLEFTPLKMRVWRYGELIESDGAPYVLTTPYDADATSRLSWVQSADVIYLADGELPIQQLSRAALDDWTIEPAQLDAGPFKVSNLEKGQTVQASAATGTITLSGVGDIFSADWVGSLMLLRPDGYDAIPLWTSDTAVASGDQLRSGGHIYEVVAGLNTGAVAPSHVEGTEVTDKNHGIKWKHISDGSGIVRITAYTDENTVTAEVLKDLPPPVVSRPTYRWSEGAWSDRQGYPSALEIYDQSLVAAFTPTEPRTIWFSTLGDFLDFTPSTEADGSFAYAISGSTTQNAGRWLKQGRRGLYIGAQGEVIRGFSNAAGQRIGPTTFDTSVEATDGCNSAAPICPYSYPIFVTKEGSRVLEVRYSFEEEGGKPLELSLPSQHLGNAGFREIVWQSAPSRLAWLRRGSGDLVAMLYDTNEDVLGWAPLPIAGGIVESLAVTSDPVDGSDILTMIVQREVDGETIRCVEELASTWGIVAGDLPMHKANHLYASVVFDLEEATDTFSVPHLAGVEVHAWTNQGAYGPIEVAGDGSVELPNEVTHAIIGLLDETHFFETLNTNVTAPDGDGSGRPRRIHAGSGIILHRTAAGYVQSVERDVTQPERKGGRCELLPLTVAADLVSAFSGTLPNPAISGHAAEVSYLFEPFGAAPLTVLGLSADIEEAA
jgi:hypothetical protein